MPSPCSVSPDSTEKEGGKETNICHAIIQNFSVNCRNCRYSSLKIQAQLFFSEGPSSPHLAIPSLPCQHMCHLFSSRESVTGMAAQPAWKHWGKQRASSLGSSRAPGLPPDTARAHPKPPATCRVPGTFTRAVTATPNARLLCTVQRAGSFHSNHYH